MINERWQDLYLAAWSQRSKPRRRKQYNIIINNYKTMC